MNGFLFIQLLGARVAHPAKVKMKKKPNDLPFHLGGKIDT